MSAAPNHPHESERQAALDRLNILDTLPEAEFDDLVLIAAQICKTPVAVISLIDDARQWFKSKIGLEISETSREVAFCAHAILQEDVFVVNNATLDERFRDNPLVTAPAGVRFYAGAPVLSPEGHPLGTLCVIDSVPREFAGDQKAALAALSRQVSRLLVLRTQVAIARESAEALRIQKLTVESANVRAEASERQLRKIFEGLPAGIAYYSRDQILMSANAAYAEINGKSVEELLGRKMEEIEGTTLYSEVKEKVTGVLSGRSQGFEKISSRGGSTKSLLVQYVPDRSYDETYGFLVFLTDISDLKQSETIRRELESKLVASSRLTALGEMAGGVAHEINTPLTIIQMTAETLQSQIDSGSLRPESVARGVHLLEETVTRIARIISGLRTFARNSENDPPEAAKLSDIVDTTLAVCRERLVMANIELRMRKLPDVSLMCRANQISQVLMSLLINSHDAVVELKEKWVEIDAEILASKNLLRLSVVDSGKGIVPEVAEKLMQPFFTTKEVGSGTGLGLSIAKGVMLDHGGDLWYDSANGNTRFVIDIPLTLNQL